MTKTYDFVKYPVLGEPDGSQNGNIRTVYIYGYDEKTAEMKCTPADAILCTNAKFRINLHTKEIDPETKAPCGRNVFAYIPVSKMGEFDNIKTVYGTKRKKYSASIAKTILAGVYGKYLSVSLSDNKHDHFLKLYNKKKEIKLCLKTNSSKSLD